MPPASIKLYLRQLTVSIRHTGTRRSCVRAAQRAAPEVRMGRVSLSRALHSIGHNVVGRLQLGRIMGGVVSHQGGR